VRYKPDEYTYVVNMSTKKFHHSGCKSVKKIKAENLGYALVDRDALIAMGYDPCGNCDP
jgi:DNA-entry nuclease